MGFAAGVMLAASFFSLIVPALGHMASQGSSASGSARIAAGSVAVGAGAIMLLGHVLPADEGPYVAGELSHRSLRLFVLAITLHNIPEGLAVGVSFADGAYTQGASTALGIGIQNIPEGFAVACALALRYDRVTACIGALLSGLVEPVAGAAGAFLVAHFRPLLPWALCLAAGAMLSVIMSHIVPSLGHDHRGRSQVALIAGLCLMMALDIALS